MFIQTGKHPFSGMRLSPDYAEVFVVHTKEKITVLRLAEDLEIRLIKAFGLPGPLVDAISHREPETQRIIR
mgnify:CR=1 FL=1